MASVTVHTAATAGTTPQLKDTIEALLSRAQATTAAGDDIKERFVTDVWPDLELKYQKMEEDVKKFCEKIFERDGLKCRIDARTKTADSIRKSLRRREEKQMQEQRGPYASFEETLGAVHDLVGIRVVLDFFDSDDHQRATQCIRDSFETIGQPVIFGPDRKVYHLWEGLFGAYQTCNYRVKVKHDGSTNPLSLYSGVLFEIQLTNFAEDVYNKLAHDILYKAQTGSLTYEDEIVLDLSRGLALCQGLTMMYMKGRLSPTGQPSLSSTPEHRPTRDVVVDGRTFFNCMKSKISQPVMDRMNTGDAAEFMAPPEHCRSAGDLRGWLAKELDAFLPTGNRLVSLSEDHLRVAKAQLRVATDQQEMNMSDQEKKCHRVFYLAEGGADYTAFKDRVKDRVDGTCHWVFDREQYKTWLEQDSGLLLVSADPGCGKSVLAKYLVDYGLPRSATICYYFFNDPQGQCTINQALCALLYQLFIHFPSLISYAMPDYNTKGKGLRHAAPSCLWDIMRNAVQDRERKAVQGSEAQPVIMVVDALDECRESDRQELLRMVRRLFVDSSPSPQRRLKFLFTTRPYPRIINEFKSSRHIHIPGEEESMAISREINLVVNKRVQEIADEKGLSVQVHNALLRRCKKVEHRTYLWVYLLFDYLQSQDFTTTEKAILSLISSLPETFYEAYERILDRSGQRDRVRKVLAIVLAAQRPLTLAEMNMAMTIDISTSNIGDDDLEDEEKFRSNLRSWCGLFVTVDDGRVYFLHQTAREFLIANLEQAMAGSPSLPPPWYHSIPIRDAHRLLAEVCVTYLGLFNASLDLPTPEESLELSLPRRTIYGFLQYASKYWSDHTREACIVDGDDLFSRILGIYDRSSGSFQAWFGVYNNFLESLKSTSSLSLASRFGHIGVVNYLLTTGKADVSSKKRRITSTRRIQIMIKGNKAGINLQDKYGLSALAWAARNGHEAVVKALLVKGKADAKLQDNDGQTALAAAAGNGHEAVVKALLVIGKADANLHDKYGRTALVDSAWNGHEAVVKALLATREVDVNLQDRDGRTALAWAVAGGREAIVKTLLATGKVDVNLQDRDGWTALAYAAADGHEGIVKALLATRKADVNLQDTHGWTALARAAWNGHEAVFKALLVTRKVDANLQDKDGWTALARAVACGYEAIAKTLLATGKVDVNLQDRNGWTALARAAADGHEGIVKALLATGKLDVNLQDRNGWTALARAAADGHEGVVKALLATRKVDVNLQDRDGRTALARAVAGGREAIVKTLLATGKVDVNLHDRYGWTEWRMEGTPDVH